MNMIEKALPREGFRNAFFKRQKTLKNQCKIEIPKSQNIDAETLINQIGGLGGGTLINPR